MIALYFFFLCILMYKNYNLDKTTEEWYIKQKKDITIPKVFDIGFKYFPKLRHLENIINVFIIILLIFILLTGNQQLIYECIEKLILIYIFRSIIINLTILPKDNKCIIEKHDNTRFLNGGCYDKIFSGHFALFHTCLLLLNKYGYIQSIYTIILLDLIFAFFIISSRAHYTIDVVVAFFVSYFVLNLPTI